VGPQLLHRQNDGRTGRHVTANMRISAIVVAITPEMEDIRYLQKGSVTGLVLFICALNEE
jgi:hypothetical protein